MIFWKHHTLANNDQLWKLCFLEIVLQSVDGAFKDFFSGKKVMIGVGLMYKLDLSVNTS